MTALIILVMLVALPGTPLIFAWDKFLKHPGGQTPGVPIKSRWQLIATTLSFLWLLVGICWASAIGPDYSQRRFVVIYCNLGAMFMSTIVSLFVRSPIRAVLTLASAALVLEWLYAAAISSVV